GRLVSRRVVGDEAGERATNRRWVRDGFEEFQKHRYGIKVEGLKPLRAWWTRRASQVIVPSRYLADWVTRWGVPAEKIAVIYNAVESFAGARPAVVPLRTPPKAVAVGRLWPSERVGRGLEALGPSPTVALGIAGAGAASPRF